MIGWFRPVMVISPMEMPNPSHAELVAGTRSIPDSDTTFGASGGVRLNAAVTALAEGLDPLPA